MTQVRVSTLARSQIQQIRIYTKQHFGTSTFARLNTDLKRSLLLIRDFPLAGPVHPEFQPRSLRTRSQPPFIILYEITARSVEIVAVLHGAQELAAALRDSKP